MFVHCVTVRTLTTFPSFFAGLPLRGSSSTDSLPSAVRLKPPKNLGPRENTISVRSLKFSKSFRRTVPKSEAKTDSAPLRGIVVTTRFQNALEKTDVRKQSLRTNNTRGEGGGIKLVPKAH